MQTKFAILFSAAAMESGVIALLWGSSTSEECNRGVGCLGFFSLVTIYNAFVVMFMFFLGFRVWRLECRFEELDGILGQFKKVSADSRNGLCLEGGIRACCVSSWDSFSCKNCVRACSRQCRSRNLFCRNAIKDLLSKECKEDEEERGEDEVEIEVEEEEGLGRNEMEDVMKLRNEVIKERELRAAAVMDLEKERIAALSATDEAMAKILCLQNEKGLIEREAREHLAIVELKQSYDQEVIEYLKWIISRFEIEREGKSKLFELSHGGSKETEDVKRM